MGINFELRKTDFVLIYYSEMESVSNLKEYLIEGNTRDIRHVFNVSESNIYQANEEIDDEILFKIGELSGKYIKLDRDVFIIEHDFYFDKSIELKQKHFVSSGSISIVRKIDDLVNDDVYVGGDNPNAIEFETYETLVSNFPKTSEIKSYASARISTILKEYYPYLEDNEQKFQNKLEKINKRISTQLQKNDNDIFYDNYEFSIHQFENLSNDINSLLHDEKGIDEAKWKDYFEQIMKFIYPKYIIGLREVRIPGVDEHDKQPDFLLIDSLGFVDVLEVKKPDIRLLSDKSIYRNNYVPSRELSGAAQQIEKYTLCLNRWGKEGEKEIQIKCKELYSIDLEIKILNPRGMLLLGRDKEFKDQRKADFELIKRQYKNIAEIITYDDLIQRITNIIKALKDR